jgi:hypothetical protein
MNTQDDSDYDKCPKCTLNPDSMVASCTSPGCPIWRNPEESSKDSQAPDENLFLNKKRKKSGIDTSNYLQLYSIPLIPPTTKDKIMNENPKASEKLIYEELIYSDGERLVFALEDAENRGGGIKGHCYQSLVSGSGVFDRCEIQFQNGNPAVFGINGHTNETILAILIHRMEYLDSIYPCDENKEGLEHLKKTKEAFEARSKRLESKLLGDECESS